MKIQESDFYNFTKLLFTFTNQVVNLFFGKMDAILENYRQLGIHAYRRGNILKRKKENAFPSPIKLQNISPERIYRRIEAEKLEFPDTTESEGEDEDEDEDEDKENRVNNGERRKKRARFGRDGELYTLSYYKDYHSGGDYKYCCSFNGCTFRARNQSTVAQHWSVKQRLAQRVKCVDCNEEFPSRSAFQQHYRIKHTNTAYPCPHNDCQKVFKSKASLYPHYARAHLLGKYHRGVYKKDDDPFFKKQHICLSCNSRFNSSNSCYYHIALCHPMSPFADLTFTYNTKNKN